MKTLDLVRFGGINNRLSPERINSTPGQEPIDLAAAVNVAIGDSGQVLRRPGQTLRVAGQHHSLWSSGERCYYVDAAGSLFALDADYASTELASGLGPARMAYVEANGRVYHANGSSCAVIDAGRVRSWGIALALTAVSASVTSGNMAPGIYLFAMTLVREDGQESGCALAQRIDLASEGGLHFSWAVPDDLDIVGVNLYLSATDSETLLLAASVNVEDGSYSYTGGLRALPLATQWCDAPPAGSALALFKGRIYIAVDEVLFATMPLSYEHCDLRDFRAFDGAPITVLGAVEGGLFVGTGAAVYFLAGASFADAALLKKLDSPALAGSLVSADGLAATGRAELAGQRVVLFATLDGVVLGLPDGSLHNLTYERYALPAMTAGGAAFVAGDASQYLFSPD